MPCSETKPPGSHRGSFKRVNFERQLLCPRGLWAKGRTGDKARRLPSLTGEAEPRLISGGKADTAEFLCKAGLMPSLQSKLVHVLVRLLRMKRASNRTRERVERGERTYTEPTRRLHRKHRISKRDVNGHLVWTIAPHEGGSEKRVLYLHGGGYV